MGNAVVHWELMSKEPAKVAGFYEKLFGWQVQHRPELNYRIVDTGAPEGGMPGINGGIVKPDREGPGRETCCSTSPSTISRKPGMSKFSLLTDSEGRMMGLWKSKAKE